MIVVVLPEGGCWQTLSALRKYGGYISHIERGGGGCCETKEEIIEDRKTTDLLAVRE